MPTQEQLNSALKELPQDKKDILRSLNPSQQRAFMGNVADQIDARISKSLPSDVRKPSVELNPVQRAVQSSRFSSIPMTPLGAIPMNGREAMDLPRVALSQFQSGVNSLPIKMGANMVDDRSNFRNRLNEDKYQEIITPQTPYGRTMNTQATIGQIAAPVIGIAGQAKNAIASSNFAKSVRQTAGDLFKSENRLDLMKKFRSSIFEAKSNAVDKFGKELAEQEAKALLKDPNHGIDLTEAISNLKNEADIEPKIKTFINSVPGLKGLIAEGSDVSKIGLKQLQDIQNQIQGRLPQGVFKNWNHPLSAVSDFISDLKAAKIESFPGMAKNNQEYAPIAEAFKLLKGKVSPNALEDFMKSGFQNTEIKQAVKTLLGKDNPILKRAERFGSTGKNLKKIGIGITAEEAFRNFVLKRR